MLIREAASESGLPSKTIRYYEDIGLIAPERSANGYREYNDHHVSKLKFLQRARSLGFSIQTCRALLSLYEDSTRNSADVKSLAENHISQIERKIQELHTLHQTLVHLVNACNGDERPDCPILDDLSGNVSLTD